MLFQQGKDPVKLAVNQHIKATDTTGLYHLLGQITLTFSSDGQRLVFIDNHVTTIGLSSLTGRGFH